MSKESQIVRSSKESCNSVELRSSAKKPRHVRLLFWSGRASFRTCRRSTSSKVMVEGHQGRSSEPENCVSRSTWSYVVGRLSTDAGIGRRPTERFRTEREVHGKQEKFRLKINTGMNGSKNPGRGHIQNGFFRTASSSGWVHSVSTGFHSGQIEVHFIILQRVMGVITHSSFRAAH